MKSGESIVYKIRNTKTGTYFTPKGGWKNPGKLYRQELHVKNAIQFHRLANEAEIERYKLVKLPSTKAAGAAKKVVKRGRPRKAA